MTTWEYCAIVATWGVFGAREIHVLRLGTDTHQRVAVKRRRGESNDTALLRTIAELGVRGWEMQGEPFVINKYRYLLFKRKVTKED